MLKMELEGYDTTRDLETVIEGIDDVRHVVWVNELKQALAN